VPIGTPTTWPAAGKAYDMLLLTATSALLFFLLQMSPTMNGPVGTAFAISMAVLGAIGILHWTHESSKGKSTGLFSSPTIQGQLHSFMTLPVAVKVILVLVAMVLPITIDAIT